MTPKYFGTTYDDVLKLLTRGTGEATGWYLRSLSTHKIKVALSNIAPNGSEKLLSEIYEIEELGGYVSGGLETGEMYLSADGGGVVRSVDEYLSFSPKGSSFPTLRYVIVYLADPKRSDGLLMYWFDFGKHLDIYLGDSFNIRIFPLKKGATFEDFLQGSTE